MQSENQSHTPGKYRLESVKHYGLVRYMIHLPNRERIGPMRKEAAMAIVRACNSHAALVEALESVAHEVRAYPDSPRSYSGDSYLPNKFVNQIRAALAAAKE